MFKIQYPTDHLKKEGVNSKITELSNQVQYIEQAKEFSQLKRYRRSDIDSESESRFKRIDVPGDGSCLFWSVTMAYLIPARNDDALFRQRYEALFGNEEAVTRDLDHIRNLVQNLSTANYDDKFANLVRNVFRNRVVDYIRDHENEFRDFVEGNFENYLENMRRPNAWGGEPEIRTMSEMLRARISVSGATESRYENGNIQIQLFHVGAPGKRNHYNFGLERGTVDNDVELAKGLKRVMGKGKPQDFELIQLLIEEAGKEVGISRQDEDFKSFETRFQSFVDQIPSYLHSVEKAGFFTHFFLGSFSTLLDTKIAEKLNIKKIYFSFDTSKTLKVAIVKNGQIGNAEDAVNNINLLSISEGKRGHQFTSGELENILKENIAYEGMTEQDIKNRIEEIKNEINGKMESRLVQIYKGTDGIFVNMEVKEILDSPASKEFHEIEKGIWSNPEDDIAGLSSSREIGVKESLEGVLGEISKVHSKYENSLIYDSSAREAAHHGFMVGIFMNFHYRYNLRVYPEQFAGRGYADIILLARGPDRALNSIPIIIELKAGEGPNATPDKALQQAKKYAQGFQPNVQRVLTTADNILCVGVNLDNPSPISDIKVSNRGEEIIPLFQDMLKSADDWDTQRIGTIELKGQVKDNLERIYHTFPGTPEKGDNHYFSRFLLGQSLLLNRIEDLKTGFKKYIFIYGNNIPTEVHPNLRGPGRLAAQRSREALSTNLDASHAVVTMVLIPENTKKLVYVINIVEANRKDVLNGLNEELPLDRLNREIGNREIVELNLNFDTRYKSDFKRYLTIWTEKYNSLQEYNNGADRFQGTFKEVPYPNELKETFDKALDIQSLSIKGYSGLLEKIGEGVFPFKSLINKEAHFQGILNGVFSYYSDLKLQESPETRALVLTEFQTGRGERIDMLVHGIKFAGQDRNAEEYTPVGLELKASRQGKGAQALLKEANDQINKEYKEGVTYRTLTDGDEVKFIGVVFDKGSNNPNKLILTSRTAKEGFIPVEVVHSSVHMLPTVGQCSKRKSSSPEYPPSKKPRRERSVSMACIDSFDEEKITEEEKKQRVKELFDTDEIKKRVKSIEFYNELSQVSEMVSKGKDVDLEDFIKKVKVIDLNSMDSKVEGIVIEIKGKISEEAIDKEGIRDILRRPIVARKISEVVKDTGLTYRRFLDNGESEPLLRNTISRITSNKEAMNHLSRIGKISGWAMQGMMYKNLVGDILSGDAEGVMINLGFIGGNEALSKLANIATIRGEKLALNGRLLLGKSLKAASSFLARGTTAFIAYDLANQVKEYKGGNNDAMVGIVGDSIVIAVDVVTLGIEVAEIAGILAGVSSVTGPIGATVTAVVFVGTEIYLAVRAVEKEDKIIHLTGWEKFKEGWRAFLHMPPEEYIQRLINEKVANNHLVVNGVNFLRQHTDIRQYVFPTGRLVEKKRIEVDPNNTVLLDAKKNDIKWSRARPDKPEKGEFFCLPQGDWESVSRGGAYVCKNAIGLSYSDNRTGNYTLIDLGEGDDKAIGFLNSPNIFFIGNGEKNFTGGDKNDTFTLHGNMSQGSLNGGSGYNTLDLTGFALGSCIDIEVPSRNYMTLSSQYSKTKYSYTIRGMQVILGREKAQDKIQCAHDVKYVDGKGGKNSSNPDIITTDHSSGPLKIVVRPNTKIINRSNKGSFSYIASHGEGEASIDVNRQTDQLKHTFLFNYTLSDLKSIGVQNLPNRNTTIKNVNFSFQPGSAGTFNIDIRNITTSASYVLLKDKTEIKIGNEGNLYALQSTDKPINDIIKSYPPMADRLNMTIVAQSHGEFVTIGHGRHEAIRNEPLCNSHLIGSGGENIYVIAPTEKKVNIYDIHDGTSISTLDLRSVVKDAQNVKISQNGNDLLIELEKEKSLLKFPVIVKNGTRWYQKLHVVLDSVPMQVECSDDNWSLNLAPLTFDEKTKIVVITARDVKEGNKLIVHKQAGQYTFSRLRDDLIITTDPSLGESNICTILLSNFYKEPKMQMLSIKFNDTMIPLQEEMDEINNSKLVFCPNALQISEGLSIDGSKLLNNCDCLKLSSDSMTFLRSSDDLLLLSDQGTLLISNYYSQVHEKWNVPIELNSNFIKPEEFKRRANSSSAFRYYKPDEQGLQIYHNQPVNENDIGLVDLKDKSMLNFDMKVINGSLLISHKNNTLVKVENWNTYQPARKMIFAFNDTIVSNSRCIASICNPEDAIVEFNREKEQKQLDKELSDSVQSNSYSKVKVLVSRGANINAKDNDDNTFLHDAARGGNLDMVKFLIKNGANINVENNRRLIPLQVVGFNSNVERVLMQAHLDRELLLTVKSEEDLKTINDLIAKDIDDRTHGGFYYAWSGNLGTVKFLVGADVSVNTTDKYGCTLLHWAALKGRLEIAKFLVDKEANVNAKDILGRTPMHFATMNNHNDIQDAYDRGPIYTAAESNDEEVIQLFLMKGASINEADKNGETPLHLASWGGHLDVLQHLINSGANISAKDSSGKTPLDIARDKGHNNLAQYLQQTQLVLDGQLLKAVQNSDSNKVRGFIAQGANIDFRGKDGSTLLYLAAEMGNLDEIRFLLDNGANIETKNGKYQATSLHGAVRNYRLNAVELLLNRSANVNAEDKNNWTPLHYAADTNSLDIVKVLVDAHANLDAKGDYGKTPLDIARDKGHNNIVEYLEQKLREERGESLQRKRRHHDGDHARHHMSRKPLAIDSSNQPEIATSSAIKPSSWINDLFDWVKGSVGGLLNSKPTLSKETSSTSSPISQVDAKMDVNGTIILLDVLVRKVTGQKYISTVDQSISPLEAQGYALNITKGFEKVVEQAALKSGISMHRLNIDYMGMQKEITREVMSGKFNEISGILKSYVEKACPGEEAGKLSPKKFEKFIAKFNKGLLNQSIEQILHNRDGRLEVDGAKQMSLEPQSYLSNASVHSHSEVSTCLSEIGVTKLGGNLNR